MRSFCRVTKEALLIVLSYDLLQDSPHADTLHRLYRQSAFCLYCLQLIPRTSDLLVISKCLKCQCSCWWSWCFFSLEICVKIVCYRRDNKKKNSWHICIILNKHSQVNFTLVLFRFRSNCLIFLFFLNKQHIESSKKK